MIIIKNKQYPSRARVRDTVIIKVSDESALDYFYVVFSLSGTIELYEINILPDSKQGPAFIYDYGELGAQTA